MRIMTVCLFLTSCALLERHPSHELIDKAYDYFREEKHDKAIQTYREVAKRYPKMTDEMKKKEDEVFQDYIIKKYLPGAEKIRTGKEDPPFGYEEIGPVSATSGHGCGGYGQIGTITHAYIFSAPALAQSPSPEP